MRVLGRIFPVRPDEIALVTLMAAGYGVVLMTQYFLKPARDAMFLIALSPSQLPIVFMLTALIAAPVASIFSRASRSTSLPRLVVRTFLTLTASILGLRALLSFDSPWVYYLFYAWVGVFGVLSTSQFWLLAGAVFDASQAKRLFTLIGAVGILGAILGGEATRWCVESLGVSTPDLLYVAAGLCGTVTLLILAVRRTAPSDLGRAPRRATDDGEDTRAGRLFSTIRRSRHLQLTVGIIAAAILTGTFVDYLFKTLSYEAISNEDGLTAFLARFYSTVNMASLLLQLLATNAVLRRFGAAGALAILPVLLTLGGIGVLIVPSLMAVSLLRGSDMALKYSLDKTGRELLFLPVPIELKRRTKLFIDLFVDRWFRGFAGLLLLVITTALGGRSVALSIVIVVAAAVWLVLVVRMRSEYLESFRRAIERRELDLSDVPLNLRESAAVNSLLTSLDSENPRQVVYALETLRSAAGVDLVSRVGALLSHSTPDVRAAALRVLIEKGDGSWRATVSELLEDPDPVVGREAVRYLVEHGDDATELLDELRGAGSPAVVDATWAYLAAFGSSAVCDALSDDALEVSIGAVGRARDVHVACVLGRRTQAGDTTRLETLLDHTDPDVVRAVLASIGRRRLLSMYARVEAALARRAVRPAARETLEAFGAEAVPLIAGGLADPARPLIVRRSLVRALGEIVEPTAADALLDALRDGAPELRGDVLRALNVLRTADPRLAFEPRVIRQAIDREIALSEAALTTAPLFASPSSEPERLFARALGERAAAARGRVFELLALEFPVRDIRNAALALMSESRETRANAREFLEQLLPVDLRAPILRVARGARRVAERDPSAGRPAPRAAEREAALSFYLAGEDAWLKSCALLVSAEMPTDVLRELGRRARSDPSPMVRETAALVTAAGSE